LNLTDNGTFKTIKYYFSVRGPSYQPHDMHFGRIKRFGHKSGRIYTVQNVWNKEHITKSTAKGRFTVKGVQTQDILNFNPYGPKKNKETYKSEQTTCI